jgi:hypothetical protein
MNKKQLYKVCKRSRYGMMATAAICFFASLIAVEENRGTAIQTPRDDAQKHRQNIQAILPQKKEVKIVKEGNF